MSPALNWRHATTASSERACSRARVRMWCGQCPASGTAIATSEPLALIALKCDSGSLILGARRCRPSFTSQDRVSKLLFYEPLFVTSFLAFYALYLLATGAGTRKCALAIASALFYIWGEPVFVLVLLLSTVADYAISFYLDEKVSDRLRRVALTTGIAGNLGVLAVYKYADFIIHNLNGVLSPFGPHLLPLLHLALPIGVSFLVFDKLTY